MICKLRCIVLYYFILCMSLKCCQYSLLHIIMHCFIWIYFILDAFYHFTLLTQHAAYNYAMFLLVIFLQEYYRICVVNVYTRIVKYNHISIILLMHFVILKIEINVCNKLKYFSVYRNNQYKINIYSLITHWI